MKRELLAINWPQIIEIGENSSDVNKAFSKTIVDAAKKARVPKFKKTLNNNDIPNNDILNNLIKERATIEAQLAGTLLNNTDRNTKTSRLRDM